MEFNYDTAFEFLKNKLVVYEIEENDAIDSARVLLEAELREDPSHGISCILKILDSIKKKEIDPSKKPSIISEEKASVLIDGKNVLGPSASIFASKIGIEKAKEYGISGVSVRQSHHLFSLGYYSRFIALQNYIGIVTSSSSPAIFAPGGLEKVLGTNPFSIGIPTMKDPIVIDMSSTTTARGKVREALLKGEEIPEGWAVDKNGKATRDPKEALEGSLQTIGGYKGFGLALAVDILSGIMSDSASGKEVFGTSMHLDAGNRESSYKGDMFIIIDPSKYLPIERFKSRVSELIESIKNSERIEDSEIYIPGERAVKNKDMIISIKDELYRKIVEY